MRTIQHLTPRDARRLPWRNGLGVTEELALWPPGARFEEGGFLWRISRASVAEDGPFSAFPGFDRVLVVTRGAGLSLAHGDAAARARVRLLEPYRFSGTWPTTCQLLAGPVADFNVLVREDGPRADVQVLPLARRRAREVIGPGHAFVHVVSGACSARVTNEEEPFELPAGDSLWAQELPREEEVDLAGRADDTVILIVNLAR